MNYLGCDPGTRNNTGFALLHEDGTVRDTACVGCKDKDIMARARWQPALLEGALAAMQVREDLTVVAAVEWQRPLPTDKRPADIVNLAHFAGMAISAIVHEFRLPPSRIYLPEPHEWKGSVEKEIMTDRIWEKLTPQERALIERKHPLKGERANVIDAVGIAKWVWARDRLLSRWSSPSTHSGPGPGCPSPNR